MTELLDEALKAVAKAPAKTQDDIASIILLLLNSKDGSPVALTHEESEALAASEREASLGQFATDEEVRAIWAKHGL